MNNLVERRSMGRLAAVMMDHMRTVFHKKYSFMFEHVDEDTIQMNVELCFKTQSRILKSELTDLQNRERIINKMKQDLVDTYTVELEKLIYGLDAFVEMDDDE